MTIITVRAVLVARQPGRSITGIIGHLDAADLSDITATVIFDVPGAGIAAVHGFHQTVVRGVISQINLAIAKRFGEDVTKSIILERGLSIPTPRAIGTGQATLPVIAVSPVIGAIHPIEHILDQSPRIVIIGQVERRNLIAIMDRGQVFGLQAAI